jgi:hypothetical protein
MVRRVWTERVPGVLVTQQDLETIPHHLRDGLTLQPSIALYLLDQGQVHADGDTAVLFGLGPATWAAG